MPGDKRVRAWPRLTPKQRETMSDFDKSKDGTKSLFGPRSGNTLERLGTEGLIRHVSGNGYGDYYTITQRGRDYVRFGMKRRKP